MTKTDEHTTQRQVVSLMTFTSSEVAKYYAHRVPGLNQTSADEWRAPCPIHNGENPSFAVNHRTGRWFCHSECGRGGGILKLEMDLNGTDAKTARAEVCCIIGRKRNTGTVRNSGVKTRDSEKLIGATRKWRTVARYIYTDESGSPLFRVIRHERGKGTAREKTFHQERYDRGRWKKGLGKVRRVPYRLKNVIPAKRIIMAEGEKDVKTLEKWNLVATTSPMGAGNWLPKYARYFEAKDVIIIPDNDDAGRAHALEVAVSLLPVARSVRILELPDLPPKGDVTDWVSTGGTSQDFESLVRAASPLDATALAELKSEWGLAKKEVTSRFPFRVAQEGVFFLSEDKEEARLAERVDVFAQTRDANNNNWGRLLKWHDIEGRTHQWAMPMELLASEAAAVRARLLSEGLSFVTTNVRLRERFNEYLQTAPVDRRVRCVARIGWHGPIYALPDQAIGPANAEETLYQSPHESVHHWDIRGAADEWRSRVGQQCSGNSRLILTVSCGFAGPLLALVGAESGGIHFLATTSTGKTTALMVGGSVCGGGGQSGFLQTWRATINGLEAIAETHNDATLFLDEISQVDPRDAGETAYLLGNGQGKARMTKSTGTRRKLTWNLLYVSAGELTLAEHAASAGKRTRGGAEMRLLNVDADAGKGLGLFENLHGTASPDVFSRKLKQLARRYYGAPLRAFLSHLTRKRKFAKRFIRKFRSLFGKSFVPANATGEVSRAADRFALIGAAGELATKWGLTGWQEGEAKLAASRLFCEWCEGRRTHGSSSDMEAAVRQVRGFIQEHQSSRFQKLDSPTPRDDQQQNIRNQAGFVKRDPEGDLEYWVFPAVFKNEICKGYSYRAVAKELEARGFLLRQPPDFTIKPRVRNWGTMRLFCIRTDILGGDE